jgi:hypothetical protein
MIATSFIVLGLLQQTFIERELAWDPSSGVIVQDMAVGVKHYVVTVFRIDTDMAFERIVTTDNRAKVLFTRNGHSIARVTVVYERPDRSTFELTSQPLFFEAKKDDPFALARPNPPIGIVE